MTMTMMMIACLMTCTTPAEEATDVAHDLERRVPPERRAETRYISLYNTPEAERPTAAAVLSFVLNTVSRASVIVPIAEVEGTDRSLWRIDWDRYGLPRAAWEAIAAEDPYWHQSVRVVHAHGRQTRELLIDGPWVPAETAAALRQMTGSAGVVLRGDFFIARASSTLEGGHYYRLAGVPETERAFFQELGIDAKTIGRLGADAGANVIRSRITHKVRRVVRRPGPLGGAWQTYDVVRSTAERDPLRNPFDFSFDAGEHIAVAPNGLHRFALYDAKGSRQDTVPDVIAKDASDPHGAGIVAPMLSCVRCHLEAGLRPVQNDQARLLSGGVDLLTVRPSEAERLADFYGADLSKQLTRDREDYAAAVQKATGGSAAKETASALAKMYADYVDELVTTETAARELGVTLEQMISALRGSHDPVLLALAEGIAVQREQWTAAFAEAAVRVSGVGWREPNDE